MKNLKINFRILVVALIALFSVSLTTPATAADGSTNLPVNLKYLGAANNAPIFQLSFTNEMLMCLRLPLQTNSIPFLLKL